MARNLGNVLTKLYSGKIGHVLMQKNGVLRSVPDMSKRILSDKQKNHLNRFEQAKAYARQVMADPVESARYSEALRKLKATDGKLNIGIYQMAIKDYMNGKLNPG